MLFHKNASMHSIVKKTGVGVLLILGIPIIIGGIMEMDLSVPCKHVHTTMVDNNITTTAYDCYYSVFTTEYVDITTCDSPLTLEGCKPFAKYIDLDTCVDPIALEGCKQAIGPRYWGDGAVAQTTAEVFRITDGEAHKTSHSFKDRGFDIIGQDDTGEWNIPKWAFDVELKKLDQIVTITILLVLLIIAVVIIGPGSEFLRYLLKS